ncbi:hypothetical protein LAWI1_G006048 [Lachnellula willkommii]|uniref:Maintenance of telomere capping protein n=1 Tax=Lachnellula willkommii TaxID=215461 RepID=A0A559MGH4_9HELO|nr:hypothetical protein LAWI1_G006048 [Lachnellula willkommii]
MTDRRTTSSSGKRYSLDSTETGESSSAASQRKGLAINGTDDGGGQASKYGDLDVPKDNHRSHRTRHSGGFLLGDTSKRDSSKRASTIEPRRDRDHKGKAAQKHKENGRSNVGSSPLATNVKTARGEQDFGGDSTADKAFEQPAKDMKDTTQAPALDVDSAQIVNLALNLSESRRNAARRNISTPLPAFSEGFAGGSLRQHLQQQRRVSRNVSPKPDRGERAMTASPRVAIQSPLQASFDSAQEGGYQYHFSASTLARAEKAKVAIELMAQYRQLLQYVPPLKPQGGGTSDAGTAPGSPNSSGPASRTVSESTNFPALRSLGREYNPLQYIRNRKVRSRNAKAIDGEAQGFGDLAKVSSWVDQVRRESSSEEYQAADCLFMPSFSKAADTGASPHTSPQSSAGKGQATAPKVKRPRIDWVTNPADMIADVFWLEQDDNKKIIEDRHGLRIFPKSAELRRPWSRRSEEPELQPSPGHTLRKEASALDLRIDTQLPKFRSIKEDPEKYPDSTTSRAKQKLRDVRDATRDVTRIHHGHNGSIHDRRQFIHSLSRSDSESSDSDGPRRLRRKRSGTEESGDRRTDILAKQMEEMLAKEAGEDEWSRPELIDSRQTGDSRGSQKSSVHKNSAEKQMSWSPSHSRSGSVVNNPGKSNRDSLRNANSSGRASLEVPGHRSRPSMEDLDSTAPNSPESRATKPASSFIPSIGMDLSSSWGRNTSPTRTPLSKVKSKIKPAFRDHSRNRSHSRVRIEQTPDSEVPTHAKEHTPDSPSGADKRRRSTSPVKKTTSRRTDESNKAAKKGSLRRGKTEESGIRGLFKNTRNPVTRVSDMLWKTKESSPGYGGSSGFSTDDSDVEDLKPAKTKAEKPSQSDSAAIEEEDSDSLLAGQEKPSYLNDMPTFTSPFERRGRPTRTRSDNAEHKAREERRKASRAQLLEPPPRIDVQNASPTSSPDTGHGNRFTRDSSVSDVGSRRESFAPGVESADARLNAILGLPGKRRNALPITGLSNLETTHDRGRERQWSISDQSVSLHRGPMTKHEIARIRALLLSPGIKAKEINRRAHDLKDLRTTDEAVYKDIAALATEDIAPVPKSQQHILAARILSDDIQLSSRLCQSSADAFINTSVSSLVSNIDSLQLKLSDTLTPMTRKAGDEADEVSKDLVTSQTLQITRVTDKIDKMMRRRRRRFRWARRGGWVMVEWALVGVMWYVWFMVVLARVVMGVGRGVVGSFRWLFWL